MHIELTDDEYQGLLIMLGYACAAAHGAKDSLLADQFLRVTNAVGRNSPNLRSTRTCFTEDEVASLNAYQYAGVMHPFTCGGDGCRADLVATTKGWICPLCDYQQNWAHDAMKDWSWLRFATMPFHHLTPEMEQRRAAMIESTE